MQQADSEGSLASTRRRLSVYAPPSSGAVLGALVNAFDLRGVDGADLLSNQSSRRHFRGLDAASILVTSELDVHFAIGRALVASGIVPEALTLDRISRRPANEGKSPLTLDAFVGGVLHEVCRNWDALASETARLTAPTAHPTLVAGSVVRLVVLDLAVRCTGLLWLAGARDAPVREFIDRVCLPDGVRDRVKEIVRDAALTRDELAEALGVRRQTIDAWLDGAKRPGRENLDRLARYLGRSNESAVARIRRELLCLYAARAIRDRLREEIGEWQAIAAVRTFGLCVAEMLALVERDPRHELNDERMRIALLVGTSAESGTKEGHVVSSMLGRLLHVGLDLTWQTSLRSVLHPWTAHIQFASGLLACADAVDESSAYVSLVMPDVIEHVSKIAGVEPRALAVPRVSARQRAIVAASEGDDESAIEICRAEVAHAPADAAAHHSLGFHLWKYATFGRPVDLQIVVREALGEFEIAAQLDPSSDRFHVGVAIVLLAHGRYEEAARRLEAALKPVSEPSTWLLLHLAFAHERQGEMSSAATRYTQLIDLEPGHGEALDRLAHIRFNEGKKAEGAKLAKRAEKVGVLDVCAHWMTGYYDTEGQKPRPPTLSQRTRVQLSDEPWRVADPRG